MGNGEGEGGKFFFGIVKRGTADLVEKGGVIWISVYIICIIVVNVFTSYVVFISLRIELNW